MQPMRKGNVLIENIFMLSLLIPMTIQDLREGRVCVRWIAVWGILGAGYHLAFDNWNLLELAAALSTGSVLLLIGWVSRGIGMGDGFLFLAVGGICGGIDCFRLLTESMLLCMTGGFAAHFLGKKGWKDQMPMVPFVLASFAAELVSYYINRGLQA